MRTFVVTVLVLIGGFFVGIIGFVLFDRAGGIRFLPFIFAIVCAVRTPIGGIRVRHRPRQPSSRRN